MEEVLGGAGAGHEKEGCRVVREEGETSSTSGTKVLWLKNSDQILIKH